MSNDRIDLKLAPDSVTVSVHGLLEKLFKNKPPGPADIVAKRFLHLIGAHGVEVPQIPRLLPSIELHQLNSHDELLKALKPNILDSTAELFGVQREWFDGAVEEIYPPLYCYKNPKAFFNVLKNINPDTFDPVRAFYSSKLLNGASRRIQPIALLIEDKLTDLGQEEIVRFHIFRDDWYWNYAPCRIQLKAMARHAFLNMKVCIPLHPVSNKILKNIISGKVVPYEYRKGYIHRDPSLEDFALLPEESAQHKESEEIPLVQKYIEKCMKDI